MAIGGLVLLVAGLVAWIGRRFENAIPVELGGRLRTGALVAAPLLVGGLLLADLRRIPDVIGALLLAVTLAVMLAVLATGVLGLRSGRVPTTQAAAAAVALVVAVVATVLVLVITTDLLSMLVFWGFAFVFLGVAALIVGLFWLLIALALRRGRGFAGRVAWSALSVAVIGLVGIVALAPRPPPVPESFADAAALDDYLAELVGSGSPPSISVVVIADGATVYEKAVGVRDGPDGLSATPETVYHWYSDTKVVTAIATMQLVDDGLIDLDDPVSEYLPFFDPEYPSPSSDPVTIADLLNHSAGLPQNVPDVIGWLLLEDDPPLDQTELVRERLPNYDELQFEPGDRGVYTNVGYYTLAAVIEQVTGQGFEEYVVEDVFDPLGMDNTRFEYTETMVANEAVGGHPLADFSTVFIPVMDPPWPTDYIRDYDDGSVWFERFLFEGNAPSGLIGPAQEKARILAMVLNGGELNGQRVISEQAVTTLLAERHVIAGASPEMDEYSTYDDAVHGIGWFVVSDDNRTFHDHSGGGPGFAAYMRLYAEEDRGIAILANGTNLPYLDLADAIAEIDWR